ncbi:transport protein TonB [Neisseria wadsworthii 9715]|uniref:Transport protein TonB n=2 Tax=Neisseria TaxID=482 RepID=G4CND1_9NEIS|nr:transport protein TonB [Neisseria wadsworthii 9715]
MENKRILIPSVLMVIILLHVGLIAALWKMTPPKPMEIMEIEFVDLGGGGGGGGAGEPAVSEKSAPEPKPVPPTVVKPKPEPKRVEKKVEAAKPKVAAVKTQNKDADFEAKPKVEAKPKFEPKPEPKREVVKEVKPEPKPEPQEKAEPLPRRQETFKPSAGEYQQKSGSGASGSGNKSEAGNGSGSGEGSGTGSGSGKGSGSGSGSGSGKGDGAGSGGVRNIGSFGVPSYPSISRENGEEGTVRLKATVSPGGGVKVEVIKSSGYSRLDNEAKRTVRGSSKFSGPGVYVGNVSFRLNQ